MREQSPHEVAERIKKGEKIEILDVREHEEWESGHIPEARHIPLGELETRHSELNKEEEMVVVCRSGNRSGMACDYLTALGYKVVNMPGGMSVWPGQIKLGK
ncbi:MULTISPECIES: rhodanese-like domain-containing protein [Paenibacillus]|uniref:rhodanese-like domain-containing protein n=1 Tax=Paenibacillus TaxID=44249 RepID=UPI0022B86933|nr:rhodanese-like domain-containing protein [Paenibacillus caseinilyticus]MCZ8521855.1 rhodanese-like domain-containing protein [Paenibacillus caseinilyticus]